MSEQLFLEAFNSEPYFFEKEEKYGAMDIIYTFEDEAGHGFKFHFEKKVALGKHAYVCVLSQKTPGLKTYKRVIGKFSNPMRTVATLLAVVRDIHATRKDVHGIVMSIPEQAFGSYARLVKKIMTRELRTVLNVEDGEYTPEDFEKMGLVGIVTTVKPRNMNTVYTGPALKEYQERQAAKGGFAEPAAVVPEDKKIVEIEMSGPIPSLSFSHNKETPFVRRIVEDLFSKYNMTQRDLIRSNGKEIIVPFRYEVDLEVVKGILTDVIAALKSKGAVPILKGPKIKKLLDSPVPDVKAPVSKDLGDVGVSLTYSSDLANLEVNGDAKHGATIKSLVKKHLSVFVNLSGIGGKFITRVDRENEQQLFVSIKSLVEELTSLGANVVQNSNVKDAIYKAKMAAAKQSDALRVAKQQSAVDPVAQVNDDGVTTIKIEVTKFDKDADTAFRANIFGRDSVEGGIALRLMRDKIKKIAGKTGQLPTMLARSIFMEGDTLKARFDSDLLAEVVAMIKSLEGATLQFKGLERLEDLIPKQPVVDPVAVKDPYYFDYDHRQITLTFDNAETAARIKDQLLELGAATFNDSEFFVDKEKLTLVDGNALDVKKVQATLFPILGNPLMMNGIFADPNIRSSVRSPDGVVYVIKGNTIQVEDAPKDSAAKIVGMVIPGVERIFDDKGNNTIELNAAGIADGHEISNFVKVLKSISINEYLSRYVFMDWDSIVRDAMDKYDLSTSSFKSLATNDGQYLINESYAGLVAEYTKTAGNVINGVVFKSTYRASDRITNLFSKDGYKVEHEVGGWGTQITIPLSSDFKLPAHDNLAKLLKELDNLSCFDRNRSIVEYVGGNRNFIAKFMPQDSRVGLRLPTDDAGYLAWRDHTSYATSPNFIRFDDIETLDQFQALVSKVKDFDFGANLLRNIGVSKYFADVRSGGPTAKKTYKLKDGGEVEITFEFGDKVMIAFSQSSKGFDKDLSEWVDEKNEIFGRISAIALYKLGTADANKTLKNIDAWLDEHIVSKEDNASSVGLTLNADFSSGNDYSASIENGALQIHDEREGVVATLSGINLDGVPAIVLSGVELHIREPEFKKSTFQGVVVDKTISVDNVKFVIKKADGTLIGRIELNSGNKTPKDPQKAVDVSTKQNAEDTFQVTLNGSGGEDDEYGVDDISVEITGSESVLANMKAKLTPIIAKYNIEELKVMDGGKALVAFFDKYSSNSTAKRFIDFLNNEFKGPKAKPANKAKPPKIERKKVNDSQYNVLIDGVIEGRITKTTSKGKATWAIYHDKSGIQIYGYLSAPTLFEDFKKQYLQWVEKQGVGQTVGTGQTDANISDVQKVATKAPTKTKGPKYLYNMEVVDFFIILTANKADIKAMMKRFEVLKSKYGAMELSLTDRDNKLVIKFNQYAAPSSITAAAEYIKSDIGEPTKELPMDSVRLLQNDIVYNRYDVHAYLETLKKTSSKILVGQVEFYKGMQRDRGMAVINSDGDGKVFLSDGKSIAAYRTSAAQNKMELAPELRVAMKKKESGESGIINVRSMKVDLDDIVLVSGSSLNESIKEDLTGKAPNRVKRELLESTLRKLGLYRESFTYGNATFKTTMSECAVEIIPTSGNIRNFAKMLGARLGQELRIDDEGFLSFDLDNI